MDYLAPHLVRSGFIRKGYSFHIALAETHGLINLQKSLKNSRTRVLFTVNLGVISRRLLRTLSNNINDDKLSLDACHWRQRLGWLLDVPHDKWWEIDSATKVDVLGSQLWEILCERGIPMIKHYDTDRSLLDLWISGKSPGLTRFQRLINLSTLASELGNLNLLEETINELVDESAGKPCADVARVHIRSLQNIHKHE